MYHGPSNFNALKSITQICAFLCDIHSLGPCSIHATLLCVLSTAYLPCTSTWTIARTVSQTVQLFFHGVRMPLSVYIHACIHQGEKKKIEIRLKELKQEIHRGEEFERENLCQGPHMDNPPKPLVWHVQIPGRPWGATQRERECIWLICWAGVASNFENWDWTSVCERERKN